MSMLSERADVSPSAATASMAIINRSRRWRRSQGNPLERGNFSERVMIPALNESHEGDCLTCY